MVYTNWENKAELLSYTLPIIKTAYTVMRYFRSSLKAANNRKVRMAGEKYTAL